MANGKPGRPKAKVDLAMVEDLASIGCTQDDIANMLGVSKETLRLRGADFLDAYRRGRNNQVSSLRRKLFQLAMQGNVKALLFACERDLGMTQKIQQQLEHSGGVDVGAILQQLAKPDLKAMTSTDDNNR